VLNTDAQREWEIVFVNDGISDDSWDSARAGYLSPHEVLFDLKHTPVALRTSHRTSTFHLHHQGVGNFQFS
jgi:hypothetical protein